MLVSANIARALQDQREAFLRAAEDSARLLERFGALLDDTAHLSRAEIDRRLAGEEWPGARPTDEMDRRGIVIPFTRRWASAQEARAWAVQALRGRPTVAVDGSQVAASKEFGVPVSLVQVSWFANPHDAAESYVKDIRNEVVLPGDGAEDIDDYAYAESKLNQRRFALEMQVAVDCIRDLQPQPLPVVLIDGSFVLSFIGRMAPGARPAYLNALFDLLETSGVYRIPVLGYVDLSFASDVTTMLGHLYGLASGNLFDARVLAQRMDAFDRTAAFQCARGDVVPYYRTSERDHTSDLCFVYLKVGQDRLPARIDFPRWVLDAGLLDDVIDLVRAEIVVGCGYPYALETADAAAVLTTQDRMAFYRLFHDFARNAEIEVMLPGKSISKLHRR